MQERFGLNNERAQFLRTELRKQEAREYNSTHTFREFESGDAVIMYQAPPSSSKVSEKHYLSHWLGLFVVVE